MLRQVELNEVTPKVLEVFGTQNALLTAGDRRACNTMTIGWCGLGRLWNLPACTVFVRPERYTYEFTEKHDYFTVSILPVELKKLMGYCGSKSGRDTDKIRDCGLTLAYGAGDAPYFEEAELVLVCKKLYVQDLDPQGVLDERVSKFYQGEGWHRVYVGQVVEAYQR